MKQSALRVGKVFVWAGTLVAIGSLAAALLAGPGYQAGLWNYSTGFVILRGSVYIAAGAGVIALIGCVLATAARRIGTSLLGLVGALLALGLIVPSWELQRTANTVPRIHDITTDTQNPPQFVALLVARRKAPNGPEYDGEKVARAQKAAYPDIQPVMLDQPPARAFERALAAARALGWEIVASVPTDGRIEATDTTRWFRFKDDIVIRVTAEGSGSRIDVRSKSRLGHGDLGTNARRIRKYVATLNATA